MVNAWNSLPDHVALSETVNTFKSRLNKFWQHQDMIYDFQAELHGTGSRSLHYNYPRRARSALGVDIVLTLDVCLYVCMLAL